jgi:hypothetical protein
MSKEDLFIVRYGINYEENKIWGVFSTKKIAKEQMEKLPKEYYDYCYIEKFKLDKTKKGK